MSIVPVLMVAARRGLFVTRALDAAASSSSDLLANLLLDLIDCCGSDCSVTSGVSSERGFIAKAATVSSSSTTASGFTIGESGGRSS